MDENNTRKIKVEKHVWPDELEELRKKRRKQILTVALCIVFFLGGYLFNHVTSATPMINNNNGSLESESRKFNEIYEIMQNEWYFGKDEKDISEYLLDQSIFGLANYNEADPHTQYLNAEEAESLMTSLSGSLTGIGIQYYRQNDTILVDKVYKDSPAEKGGLIQGDIITKVDGVDITDVDIDKIKEMIMGEEGTKVRVEIKRGSEVKTVEMTRATISITAYGYVRDGVGIIELSSFSDNTADEVAAYAKSFKEQNVKSIVLDLRNNGGGYVQTALDIAGIFMGSGKTVIYQEDKNGNLTSYESSNVEDEYTFDHYAILMNANTASASELLAAAFQEHLDATLVGTKSYGKGTVQQSIDFNDGSIFKFTVAEWLTPSKEKINKVGLKPDEEVNLPTALTFAPSADTTAYKVDSVGAGIQDAQIYLDFLGYDVDRQDGYYSQKTADVLKQFEKDNQLEISETINDDILTALNSACARKWHDEKATLDVQLLKAIEVVK